MPVAERTLKITNKLGLHARAAAKLVQAAARFRSEVKIARLDAAGGSGAQATEVNAKSIMGVLMLAAAQGMSITVTCEGEGAKQCVDEITKLVKDRFGEPS